MKCSYEVHDLLTFAWTAEALTHYSMLLSNPPWLFFCFFWKLHIIILVLWFKHTTVQEYFPTTGTTETPKLVQIPEPGVHNCCFSLFTLHEKICGFKLVSVAHLNTSDGYATERPKVWHLAHFSVVFFLGLQRKHSRIGPLCVLTLINRHKASRGLSHFRLFPEHTVMPSLRSRRSRATDWKSRLHLVQNADRGKPAPTGSMWLFQHSSVCHLKDVSFVIQNAAYWKWAEICVLVREPRLNASCWLR